MSFGLFGNEAAPVVHDIHCTWQRHVDAGEAAPGQSFWGELNYIWCMANCTRPLRDVDYLVIYDAAHGPEPCLHRLQYIRLWRVAILLERLGLSKKAHQLSRRADDMNKQRSNDRNP